jgi:MGT family glycosyltransferase
VAVHAPCFEDDVVLSHVDGPLTALRAAVGLPADACASLLREPVFCAFPAAWDSAAGEGAGTLAPFRARMPEDPAPTDIGPWRPAGDPSLPLVYLTFGTLAGSIAHIRFVYRLALDAVADLPVRAVLTTGPGIEPDALGLIPSNVEVKAWIPQREVLAHAAAVVCHGGSGTLRGALAAGLPLVVLPFGADQPFNARRIAAVGAGLSLENPDVAALRAAVQRVLIDADLRAGAQKMAAEIAALPPLERAVDALIALARAR